MKIAVTGSSGLIGSRFVSLLQGKFDFVGLDQSKNIDIVDRKSLFEFLNANTPSHIIHFAAKTDVDGCESDKDKDLDKMKSYSVLQNGNIELNNIIGEDWKSEKSAFAINAVGTKNLTDYAMDKNINFIYISTDFVFSGNDEYYTEESKPDPVDWYGQTKYWGEEIIRKFSQDYIIARLSFPFGYQNEIKKDIIWKIIDLFESKDKVTLVSDQVVTPTFIDDIVYGLEYLIDNEAKGVYHINGGSFLTPYEMGLRLVDAFSLDKNKIRTIDMVSFYTGRAKRPFKSRMKHDKLIQSGFNTKTFEEALQIIAKK